MDKLVGCCKLLPRVETKYKFFIFETKSWSESSSTFFCIILLALSIADKFKVLNRTLNKLPTLKKNWQTCQVAQATLHPRHPAESRAAVVTSAQVARCFSHCKQIRSLIDNFLYRATFKANSLLSYYSKFQFYFRLQFWIFIEDTRQE